MPEEKRRIQASVQKRSLLRELAKDAMDEIIIPKSRDTMRNLFGDLVTMGADALKTSMDKALYKDGNIPSPRNSSNTYTGVTNYQSYSRPIGTYQSSNTKPQSNPIGQRPGNAVNYIWVWTDKDAEYLINMLKREIETSDSKCVKVAKLYEELGQPTTFADFKYGWTDPNAFGYYEDFNRKTNEPRWFLDLPRPVDLTQQR